MTGPPPEAPALRTARVRFVGAALLIALTIGLALDLAPTPALQDAGFDALQKLSPRVTDASPVTIVEIDERSLADLGRWPWPRTVLAQLVHTINAYGPLAIGIDVVMSEPDPLSPERALAHVDLDLALVQRLAALPSNDAELASAFKGAPTVVVLADAPGEATKPLHVSPILVLDASGHDDAAARALAYLPRFTNTLSSLATLNDAASGWGIISVRESQGIIRRVPLVASVNGTLAPAFALEMWRVGRDTPPLRLLTSDGLIQAVAAGERLFATEFDGSVRIHFSPHDARRFVSAVDVRTQSVPAERLHGKFVLIGVTAAGVGDVLWTPIGERMPGVELHAQLLENMDDGEFLIRPAWAPALEAAAFLLIGALIVWLTPRLPAGYAALIAVTGAGALLASAYALFRAHRLLFDAATPALALLLLFATLLAFTLSAATRNRKALQQVVQRQREESARVAGEMQAAQRIQLDTLPRAESLTDPRVELAASMEPALEVGGDLYDFYLLDDDRLFFMLGDVSGKGLPASIFMAVSKALCKSTMLRAQDADLGALIAQTNVEVSRDNPAALFVTVFAGVLDLRSGALDYCNAGQENPWLVGPGGARIRRLTDGGGPPLCAVDGFAYRAARASLESDDMLCIVSDGVTEANDPARALYGTARVARVLEGAASAHAAVAALRSDVKTFAAGAEPADDMTVLALRWHGPSAPQASRSGQR